MSRLSFKIFLINFRRSHYIFARFHLSDDFDTFSESNASSASIGALQIRSKFSSQRGRGFQCARSLFDGCIYFIFLTMGTEVLVRTFFVRRRHLLYFPHNGDGGFSSHVLCSTTAFALFTSQLGRGFKFERSLFDDCIYFIFITMGTGF
jgi:hypothetical protein